MTAGHWREDPDVREDPAFEDFLQRLADQAATPVSHEVRAARLESMLVMASLTHAPGGAFRRRTNHLLALGTAKLLLLGAVAIGGTTGIVSTTAMSEPTQQFLRSSGRQLVAHGAPIAGGLPGDVPLGPPQLPTAKLVTAQQTTVTGQAPVAPTGGSPAVTGPDRATVPPAGPSGAHSTGVEEAEPLDTEAITTGGEEAGEEAPVEGGEADPDTITSAGIEDPDDAGTSPPDDAAGTGGHPQGEAGADPQSPAPIDPEGPEDDKDPDEDSAPDEDEEPGEAGDTGDTGGSSGDGGWTGPMGGPGLVTPDQDDDIGNDGEPSDPGSIEPDGDDQGPVTEASPEPVDGDPPTGDLPPDGTPPNPDDGLGGPPAS